VTELVQTREQCRWNVTLRRFRITIVAVVLHILSVSIVLGSQHAMRMRLIVICGMSGTTLFFFHTIINGTDFEKKSN